MKKGREAEDGSQKPEARGLKPELGSGIPPPRIGWNRLALIRNQALTGAKAKNAGCADEEDGSSGPPSVAQLRRVDRMPEAR